MTGIVTKVKMCGIRRIEDIGYVNRLLPDYIGYVFAPKSKRYISPERASELTGLLDKRITPVGVFVDETIEKVVDIVKSGTIKIAQLHGHENEEYIAGLHRRNITVIRAFIVKSEKDAAMAEKSSADYILLDSGMGSGKIFDHRILRNMTRKYFLAGGLDADNVGRALKIPDLYAVDVSSGLETNGFKDFNKMKKFMNSIDLLGN